MPVLSIKEVSYQYKNKYQTVSALDGISYEFDSGKMYVVIGKSGSGKTTLLSLLAGLSMPTMGKILFHK